MSKEPSEESQLNSDKQNTEEDKDIIHSKYTKEYIELLQLYNENVKNLNKTKLALKIWFFGIIMLVLTGLVISFVIIVAKTVFMLSYVATTGAVSIELIVGSAVPIISSFATVIVALNKLPKIIARYLFDSNEDQNMTQVIKNIQDYEINMGEKEKSKEAILMEITSESEESNEQLPEDFTKKDIPTPQNKEDTV